MEQRDRSGRAVRSVELEVRDGRRRVALSVAKVVVGVALMVTGYSLLPVDGGNVALRLVIALVALLGSLVVSIRYVATGDHPMLRAIESLTLFVSFAMVSFASVYVLISEADPAAFSEPLGHADGLYFAITTSTTVGFGDITPTTTPARIVVTVQMVATVALLGVGARVLFATARRSASDG